MHNFVIKIGSITTTSTNHLLQAGQPKLSKQNPTLLSLATTAAVMNTGSTQTVMETGTHYSNELKMNLCTFCSTLRMDLNSDGQYVDDNIIPIYVLYDLMVGNYVYQSQENSIQVYHTDNTAQSQ